MALYFDNEGVHELLHVMTPTKTLEAYGLLDRAKQGYNPFRNDQHPTSFRKPKRPDGAWRDFAEGADGKYDSIRIVCEVEGLDRNKDFHKVLAILAKMAGMEERFEQKGHGTRTAREKKERRSLNLLTQEEKALLGLVTQIPDVPIGYGYVYPGQDIIWRKDPLDDDAPYVVWASSGWDPLYELAKNSPDEYNELIREKAEDAMLDAVGAICAIEHPEYRPWTGLVLDALARTYVPAGGLMDQFRERFCEAYRIYYRFGGLCRTIPELLAKRKQREAEWCGTVPMERGA